MGTQIKLDNCQCGEPLTLRRDNEGVWSYCKKTRPWNFWKHWRTTRHAWFPKQKNLDSKE